MNLDVYALTKSRGIVEAIGDRRRLRSSAGDRKSSSKKQLHGHANVSPYWARFVHYSPACS